MRVNNREGERARERERGKREGEEDWLIVGPKAKTKQTETETFCV